MAKRVVVSLAVVLYKPYTLAFADADVVRGGQTGMRAAGEGGRRGARKETIGFRPSARK